MSEQDIPLHLLVDKCQQKAWLACHELWRRALDPPAEWSQEVWNLLVLLYSPHIQRFIQKYFQFEREQTAEDITQQTWEKFMRAIEKETIGWADFPSAPEVRVKSIVGYMLKIARNLCYDFFQKKQLPIELLHDETVYTLAVPMLDQLMLQALFEEISDILCMGKADEKRERAYLNLCFINNLSPDDMLYVAPRLFPDIKSVYKVRDRLQKRWCTPSYQMRLQESLKRLGQVTI